MRTIAPLTITTLVLLFPSIARAQADSVEPAVARGDGHSASEASALIAEDVIADPPRRPRTVTNGMSIP